MKLSLARTGESKTVLVDTPPPAKTYIKELLNRPSFDKAGRDTNKRFRDLFASMYAKGIRALHDRAVNEVFMAYPVAQMEDHTTRMMDTFIKSQKVFQKVVDVHERARRTSL